MDFSDSTPSSSSPIPFKSKKTLHSISKSPYRDQDSLSSKTPDKPPQLLRRARNRNAALSIKDIRRAAECIRESNRMKQNEKKECVRSARRQIAAWPDENAFEKSHGAVDVPMELPEKYEILSKFFDSLDSALRLLRMKGSSSSFTNVSPKIECLTDRRFSYRHLAQLKYILPEAIGIKKILVFDERTSCMKPDLHITVTSDALENAENLKAGSGNIHLRKRFRLRLTEFVKSHPEHNEVPEDALPEPFNSLLVDMHPKPNGSPVKALADPLASQQSATLVVDKTKQFRFSRSGVDVIPNIDRPSSPDVPVGDLTEAPKQRQLAGASHLSRSFRRHFSQKAKSNNADETSQLSKISTKSSGLSCQSPGVDKVSSSLETSVVPCPVESSDKSDGSTTCLEACTSLPEIKVSAALSTEKGSIKDEDYSYNDAGDGQSTPAKCTSTPIRLMISTAALDPPKKSHLSPDDDDNAGSMNKLARRPPRSRSLKFDTPQKTEKVDELIDASSISVHDDIYDVLPESLWESIREKERKAKEEQSPAISLAKKRRKIIASLPKLFNMVHFLFQSAKRTVITKEELIHKIVAGNPDIVERNEVEEQMSLMLELVPEWISEKASSVGDLLICINKFSSADLIRARLEEAK